MSRLLAALAASSLLLAACGDDDDGGARTVTVPAGKEVRVVADEYAFDPSGLVVEGGGSVELSVENDGSLAHDLKVLDGERELGGTPIFQAGETRSARLRLEPGEYRYVCTVGDHEELGMRGTLEVR
jgi:plastocyanin